MAIVKIEINRNEIINIDGTDVTIMVVDYDGSKDMHFGKTCDVTLMDYSTKKEIRKGEFTFTGNPDY